MSLFGGSSPPSRSSHESDSSRSSSARSSPSVEEVPTSPNAQNAQQLDAPIPLGADDDIETDSEAAWDESEGDDEEEEPPRPNRFIGQPQAWHSYTEADRQIAESLDQTQHTDLAAHLYNAHALKRRLRQPAEAVAGLMNWHSRDVWLRRGKALEYADASGLVQTELLPPKEWTAWPLPPAQLAGVGGRPGRGLADSRADGWTIGRTSAPDAGEELREELLAVVLRQAKESWNLREADSSEDDAAEHATRSRSRSRSKSAKSIKSNRSTSRTDVDMEDEETQGGKHSKERTGKRRGRKPRTETCREPVVLADDARAQRLLAPSIQSMMSKLDDLALAMRRTRMNHFGRGGPGDSSQSEFTSGAESSRLASRASSRARAKGPVSRHPRTGPRSRAKSGQDGRSTEEDKKVAKDRTELSEGDVISSNSSDPESLRGPSSRQRKRRRSPSTTSDSSASTTGKGPRREGLMDWSEVLGLAAVIGWDERAIARTAQRCAALFGESMSFRPFHESLASRPVSEPVLYKPSLILAPDVLPISQVLAPKRPFFQPGTLRCPHVECFGCQKDFEKPHRVVEHCIRVHGYDPRTNDSDNEERTVGGVHVDGFLQPVTVKSGWLGNGRMKAGKASKKEKKGKKDRKGIDAPEAVLSS